MGEPGTFAVLAFGMAPGDNGNWNRARELARACDYHPFMGVTFHGSDFDENAPDYGVFFGFEIDDENHYAIGERRDDPPVPDSIAGLETELYFCGFDCLRKWFSGFVDMMEKERASQRLQQQVGEPNHEEGS